MLAVGFTVQTVHESKDITASMLNLGNLAIPTRELLGKLEEQNIGT